MPRPRVGEPRLNPCAPVMRAYQLSPSATGSAAVLHGVDSAPAARATLDTAAREVRGVQQPRQFLWWQIGHLLRNLADRPALGIGLLGDRSALLIPDDGIQGCHENRVAIERLGNARFVDLEAG